MRSLEIESQIIAVCGNLSLILTSSGKTILVRCPRFDSCKDVLNALHYWTGAKEVIEFLHERFLLEKISLTFELRGRSIFQLGFNSKPGMVSRLLGVYPAEVRISQLCALFFDSIKIPI